MVIAEKRGLCPFSVVYDNLTDIRVVLSEPMNRHERNNMETLKIYRTYLRELSRFAGSYRAYTIFFLLKLKMFFINIYI